MYDNERIQRLLDRRGIVTLAEPGVYEIHQTLRIFSGTRFIAGPATVLRAAPGLRCALLENAGFAGESRERDISVEGGVWDGNCDASGLNAYEEVDKRLSEPYSPSLYRGKLIRFAHVDGLHLEKMTVKDPVSYGVQIADARYFTVRDLHFDYNAHFGTTDGVHINGPASDGLIENMSGTTNDDMVSLTTDDECHAEVTRGDIERVEIRNVHAENGYSGVRLLSSGHAMRNVRVSGVYGTYRHNAVVISHHNVHPGAPVWFDNIAVEHVYASKSREELAEDCFRKWEKNAIASKAILWFAAGVKMGNVLVRDVWREEKADTRAPLVLLEEGLEVDRMTLENIGQTLLKNQDASLLENHAKVKEMRGDGFLA